MIKCVIDTNVYISGIFWKGKPGKILHLGKKEKFINFISQPILDEIKDVLTRKDKPFKLLSQEAEDIIANIISYSFLIKPNTKLNVIKEDEQDNRILECALESGANYIISGDPHIRELKKFKDIEMVSPTEFLEIIKNII